MKYKDLNIPSLILLILLLAGGISEPMYAQPMQQFLPPESGEHIELLSDRGIYTVSESIYFTCAYYLSMTIPYEHWSKVMYVELIGWDGLSHAQSKVSIRGNRAAGALVIPTGLKTGNYYLRAYTRWMRNYDPLTYAYLPVKIVNPATDELYAGPDKNAGLEFPEYMHLTARTLEADVTGIRASYGKREKVSCTIQFNHPEAFEAVRCVSVVPAGLAVHSAGEFDMQKHEDELDEMEIAYYPETEGISLTAVVVDRKTRNPVPGMKVSLSSFTNSFYFGADRSDERGNVLFSLPPYHGMYEFYMVTEGEGREDVELLINNDFCNKAVALPYIPFELSEDEKDIVASTVRHAQLTNRFHRSKEVLSDPQMEYPFYGKPYSVVIEDDFIQLIDLKEFFFELVPNVSVFSLNRNPYLVVHSETSLSAYPALVMIDNIPVDNDADMLATPCSMIDRIEVVNSGYTSGPYKYSGIVSIYSLNKDIAGYSLPDNSHFFNFSLYSDHDFRRLDYSTSRNMDRIPDLRNTLYWNPDIDPGPEGNAKIEFYTSDIPGTYEVIIRCLATDGAIKEYVTQFDVK